MNPLLIAAALIGLYIWLSEEGKKPASEEEENEDAHRVENGTGGAGRGVPRKSHDSRTKPRKLHGQRVKKSESPATEKAEETETPKPEKKEDAA